MKYIQEKAAYLMNKDKINKIEKPDAGERAPKDSKRKKIKDKAQEAAAQMRGESHSLGSYTGTAQDGGAPEQDADDL